MSLKAADEADSNSTNIHANSYVSDMETDGIVGLIMNNIEFSAGNRSHNWDLSGCFSSTSSGVKRRLS